MNVGVRVTLADGGVRLELHNGWWTAPVALPPDVADAIGADLQRHAKLARELETQRKPADVAEAVSKGAARLRKRRRSS